VREPLIEPEKDEDMDYKTKKVLVLFNEASKLKNDQILAQVSGWSEVEQTRYNNEEGTAATVTANSADEAKIVADRLGKMGGVLKAFVPPCPPVG
jgi:hypothetical protein